MDVCLEFPSYQPALYSPPSPHLWTEAAAGAGPHPLSWKVSGPPSASNQLNSTPSSFRRAEGPPSPTAGSLAASRLNTTAPAHSKPFSAAANAAVFTSAAAADAKGPRSAVLGSALAGYTSVITRTPISPSGYAVPVQPKQHQHPQTHQQQPAPGSGSIHTYGNPQLLSSIPDRVQPTAGYYPSTSSNPGSSSAHHQACSPAAAALAALSGGHARTSSAPAAGSTAAAAASGSYSQQYAARNYTPAPVPSSSSSGGRGSMLLWNIQQPPPQVAPAQGQHTGAIAGRRAATAGATGYDPSPGVNSGSGSRPASQESGSPGLMKLKQLSTARLVRRLGTPPTAQQDSNISGGGFGVGPAAASPAAAGLGYTPQGSSPAAERRAAAVGQQPAWQQTQQQESRSLAGQYNPPQQQQQRAHAMQRQQQGQLLQQGQQTNSRDASWRPQQQSGTYRRSSSEGSSGMRNHAAPLNGSSTVSNSSRQPGQSIPYRAQQQQTSSSAGFSKQLQELPPDAQYVEVDRQPCPSCGRCFAQPALQQHVRICDKVFGQKRKAFDVKAQRLQGTGAAAAAQQQQRRGNSAGKGSSSGSGARQQQRGGAPSTAHDKRSAVSATQAKKPAWQKQSEQLRAAMRATKPQAAGSGAGWGGGAQVEEVEDSRVECPHCGRRFAELVAERHIPKCADIIAKPSRLKAAGGRSAYMRNNSSGSR